MPERLISCLGLFVMIAIAWGISENRKQTNWRLVVSALGLQFALALLILRTRFGPLFFGWVRDVFIIVTDASNEGASFIFGSLTKVIELSPGTVVDAEGSFFINGVLAFSVLPTIIVVSALAGILYHLRVIPFLISAMAKLMQRTLKTSGAETFGVAILIFMGIEGMTTLKAYLKHMTRSELMVLMTAFMATIAANVSLIYASFGAEPGHLLAASIMSAPAALLIAKIMIPVTDGVDAEVDDVKIEIESHNVMDGAVRGASEGVMLALNIGAVLITFVALIFLVNQGCSWMFGMSFTEIMGWFFRPFAWVMGIPLSEVAAAGELLGTKTVVNEFLAYESMGSMLEAGKLSPRSITILTYALCGFANPGSL
ncbi:MAG: nucleoside transporter C-terminal domain-containing protein, partial [Candidatus Hydrogenedentota bacterium]